MEINIVRSNLLGQPKKEKISALDVILIVLIIVLIANIFVQSFWISPVKVDGKSMMNTLQNEDWLYMDKLKKPERGDIIVFKVSEDVHYIKRIIALPRESIKTQNGVVLIKKKGSNEWVTLNEPYAYFEDGKRQGTYHPTRGTDVHEVVLEDDEIFVMGDNRWGSRDSREIGAVKVSSILGIVPMWALDHKEDYAKYLDFIEKVSSFFGKKNAN